MQVLITSSIFEAVIVVIPLSLNEFIESLESKHFKKVQAFFDTMPKLKHSVKVKNPKTKKESEIVLVGLNDFFQ